MTLIDELLDSVAGHAAAATPVDVRIGGYWTGVTLRLDGVLRGGLSSTLGGDHDDHHHGGGPPVRAAGRLLEQPLPELLALARSKNLLEASVGFATLNALLDVNVAACMEVNAEEVIAERGAGRDVAIVGHFPFTPRIRELARRLWVLELHPREGDLPAGQAPDVLPQADVVAMTGTALLNHTCDDLLRYCRPDAYVLLLGGTAPLSPVLFRHGVSALSGTVLVEPEAALRAISQGATFKQIAGKRLLTWFREA